MTRESRFSIFSSVFTLVGLLLYLVLHFGVGLRQPFISTTLYLPIAVVGLPLLWTLIRSALRGQFGTDLLAGISVVSATVMRQPLVAAIIVLMYSGGQTLEQFATDRASSVLRALARRMPSVAHRVIATGMRDIPVQEVRIGDKLLVLPHEICPVDGTVVSGNGMMDESFLTGEPFRIRKIQGSQVISGAMNEEAALTIIADKVSADSRFARIVQVVEAAEKNPPQMRRMADRIGAAFTPIAVAIAATAWAVSGHAERFLAVVVIATPCPLLLAIPVAIIGAISLSAKHGIIIKKPVVLEQVGTIRSMFFDKTGTLTHGEPVVTDVIPLHGVSEEEVLTLAASLEQFSKHPLAKAITDAATQRHLRLREVENVSERPGKGLSGTIQGDQILLTGRGSLTHDALRKVPPAASGMECIVVVNGQVFGIIHFHDRPRREGKSFVGHLGPKHHIDHVMILSGDRSSEVQYLADLVGIEQVRVGLAPEEKLAIVQAETSLRPTLFLGDGINDAPAMVAATVGVAFGATSDITAEAAGAVILEPSLSKLDELIHIGKRMRMIALQSAIGGIVLSSIGMAFAAAGILPPLAGAVSQELIDLAAVLNALRAAFPGRTLVDFARGSVVEEHGATKLPQSV